MGNIDGGQPRRKKCGYLKEERKGHIIKKYDKLLQLHYFIRSSK
jgi:hypothetical protein